MNKPNITCDICLKENTPVWATCCEGMKWCFECDYTFFGLCPICKKDELNTPVICDICAGTGNLMSVRPCSSEDVTGCEMLVCKTCSKQGTADYVKTNHFCSEKHFAEFVNFLRKSTR